MRMSDVTGVRERVQTYLSTLGPLDTDDEGRYRVPSGSTRVVLDVVPSADDSETIVRMIAVIVFDVPLTTELYEYVALHADNYYFGSLGLWPNADNVAGMLLVRHSLLGDYLDKEELIGAVRAIGATADQLDSELQARFGGTRNDQP
jgi:hypothetical protein